MLLEYDKRGTTITNYLTSGNPEGIIFSYMSNWTGQAKYKLAIFVDCEFWHGFDGKSRREQIKSNRLFWIPKIERNMQKDERVNGALRDMGYTVFRFWSQDVLKKLPAVVNQIELFLETRRLRK